MFLPPKLTTIILSSLISSMLLTSLVSAQQSEFENRIAAMEQARRRAQQSVDTTMRRENAVRDAQYSEDAVAPRNRVAQVQATVSRADADQYFSGSRGVVPAGRGVVPARQNTRNSVRPAPSMGRYVPQHVRMAQLVDEAIVDEGSPIVESGSIVGEVYSPMDGEYYEGEMIDGGCSTCGDSGSYFCNDCCGRGGCPPGPCWLSQIGVILRKGDYFWGATAFRSPLFPSPGATNGDLANDSSQGFYGGFNFGIPLCRLTCGVFSGQFGVRAVDTNLDGSQFAVDERNQVFITTGFYRRVDCGFQFGMVADILHEEWIAQSDVVQLRGDFGRVYPSGSTLGFRFATNVGNDTTDGIFNGNSFTNLLHTTDDNYRFYWRRQAAGGGYGEFFGGWSGLSQGIIGLDFDLPLADRIAMQAGFTYYLNDDGVPANGNFVGGNQYEGYNLFVGMSFRPQGRSYYRNYDRPLFSVADNGTMMSIRN